MGWTSTVNPTFGGPVFTINFTNVHRADVRFTGPTTRIYPEREKAIDQATIERLGTRISELLDKILV